MFSRDGKYIYFLSNRDFNLTFSAFEFNYLYNKATRIYALALTRDTPPLFSDKNDLEPVKEAAESKPGQETKKPARRSRRGEPAKEPPVRVRIDVDGSNGRVTAFPLKSGDYAALRAIDGGILYFKEKEIRQFKLEDKKDSLVIAGVDSGVLSADGQKILYQAQNQFGIVGLVADQKAGDGSLNLSQLTMKIEPLKEWTQIFNDGWRIFRDWFYQKKLHGVDWLKLKEKYAAPAPVPEPPRRPGFHFRRAGRRGQFRPHLCQLGRFPPRRAPGHRPAGGGAEGRRQGGPLPDQQDLRRRELERVHALAADRAGRRRPGRRLPHRPQRLRR